MSFPISDQSPLPSSSFSMRSATGFKMSERTSSAPSSAAAVISLRVVLPAFVFARLFTMPFMSFSFFMSPDPYAALEPRPKSFSVRTSIAALLSPVLSCVSISLPSCLASCAALPAALMPIAARPAPGRAAFNAMSPANCAPAMPRSTANCPKPPSPSLASFCCCSERFFISSAFLKYSSPTPLTFS